MQYSELLNSYKEEMIKTLTELVSIKSVDEQKPTITEKGTFPFGTGVQEAFEYMLDLAKKDGFDTLNVDNYGGHIEFGGYILDEDGEITGTSEETMGIMGHLDTVPEGDHWKHDPFKPVLEDGKLYGRGTCDDKGPLLAAYYAMKALKDSGFVPEKKVRLILGLDEETNWNGMNYYFSKVRKPDFGFTPDADFPAINAEMGLIVFDIAGKFTKSTSKGLELRSMTGGNAPNMVADYARAVVRDEKQGNYAAIREALAAYKEETGYRITVKGVGKSLEIAAYGKSSHGARPWDGLNAISILMDFLGRLNFANDSVGDFIDFYNRHIGFDLEGNNIGAACEDEASGKLIFNVGMVEMTPKSVNLTVNIRYPVTKPLDEVYESMMPAVNRYNLGIVKKKYQKPIFFEKNDPFIVTLMDVYRERTGDTDSEPIAIGGGSYARSCDGIVAFGARFPHEVEMAHQTDEYIDVDSLFRAAGIYADCIYRLTKPEQGV